MASIENVINGVKIEFKEGVNNNVDPKLLIALAAVIKPAFPFANADYTLFISSANDSHEYPSRHMQMKAVDISRINGQFISGAYGVDPFVTEIVERIQRQFELVPGRRENFGPFLKLKSGQPHNVAGHNDHIHLSID